MYFFQLINYDLICLVLTEIIIDDNNFAENKNVYMKLYLADSKDCLITHQDSDRRVFPK